MTLSDYRSKKGLSRAAFGLLVEVSAESIRRYESGQRFPSRDILKKIRAVTDGEVTPDSFLSSYETDGSEPEVAA